MLAQSCNIAISGDVIYVSVNGNSKAGPDAGIVMFSQTDHQYPGRLEGEAYGFYRPRGLSFNGNILQISETLSGKIIQIDLAKMQRVEDLGEFGHLRGHLISPKDIHFDPVRKTLYVVNHRAGRIEALQVTVN